jgi:hypothetical protein
MEVKYEKSLPNFLETLSYSLKNFAEILKQQDKIDVREELLKVGLYLLSEARNNGLKQDFILDFFPKPYRPVVEAIIEKYKKEPWDVTVDFISGLIKELGKDKEKGVYRPTEEVVKSTFKKLVVSSLVKELFTA